MISSSFPRVAGVLVGDIRRDPVRRAKFGLLFDALNRHLPLVDVYNADLRGIVRLATALRTVRLGRRRWRERFYKNVRAFRHRSRRAAVHLHSLTGHADVVLQIGALLDARWNGLSLPSVIYTDYTAQLSARSSFTGRSPLTPRQLESWLDVETQAYRRAAHVCTRSEHVRASLISDYGLPEERVTTIGGGVNFRQLPALEPRQADRPPTVLFIGKELHRKGGDVLLRAFAKARVRALDARLVLVTEDRVPRELPLAGVTVVRGGWNRAKIVELFRAADLLALPSRLETWGDVLLEAMAYGLPCIGVRGEAMEEIIVDGGTGLLVPAEDTERLAAALTELLLHPRQRQQLGLAARRRVEAAFTWEQVVRRMTPILEEAAE